MEKNPTAKTEPVDAEQPLVAFDNDSEVWIAHSIADARAMYFANYGDDDEQLKEAADAFRHVGSDAELSINFDDGRGVVKQTIATWIAESGRGFLCSEDF